MSENIGMDCESIIERVGSFGLYQKLLGLFLCSLIAPFFAFNDLTQFLLFLEPNHSCDNPKEEVHMFFDVLWFVKSEERVAKQCELIDKYGNKTECIFGHKYNYSHIYSTIVSENNWVCDQSWKLFFIHTIYWTGSLFGVHFIGSISDNYGRVPAIAVCHLISAIAGTTTVLFADNFYVLLISRAFMGFVVLSQGMFAVVLVMEFVGIDGRMIISTIFLLSYSITATILPWIAYYIHNWKILSIITSVPLFSIPILCFFIPESLRWLISKGKVKKAEKILKSIAKINRKEISEQELSLKNIKRDSNKNGSLLQLFQKPYRKLLKIFLLTNIIWSLQNIGYTGVNIYAANVSNSPFIMLSVNSGLDVVATFFSNKFSNSFGRKKTTVVSCVIAGVAYISASFIPSSLTYIQIPILLAGRLSFTCGYNVQYIYAAEVYPTVIRSRALAVRLAVGSIGNLISPQIVELSIISKQIPLIIFGFSAFMASALMYGLPETLNKPLPETLEDGQNINKKFNIRRRSTFISVGRAPVEIPNHFMNIQNNSNNDINGNSIELEITRPNKKVSLA